MTGGSYPPCKVHATLCEVRPPSETCSALTGPSELFFFQRRQSISLAPNYRTDRETFTDPAEQSLPSIPTLLYCYERAVDLLLVSKRDIHFLPTSLLLAGVTVSRDDDTIARNALHDVEFDVRSHESGYLGGHPVSCVREESTVVDVHAQV